MSAYSFQDVNCAIAGPFTSINIGYGSGSAEEGIEIEMVEDKSSMVIGADGKGQHNLHAGRAAKVMARFLKTSPTNALLERDYHLQTTSAANHGQNTITLTNIASGDIIVCRQCAYVKLPKMSYGKDGPMMEWVWDAITAKPTFGVNGYDPVA